MSKKKKQKGTPTPPAVPKWIENSHEPRSKQEITEATNARLAFRALRRALGLTQPEMAQRLGVSLASVQGAESGWRPVSRDLARRIQCTFGVFASSVTGKTREPVTLVGEQVTPETVARVVSEEAHQITDKDLDDFTGPLKSLVRAAASAHRLRVFGAAYKDMLRELKNTLALEEPLAAALHIQTPAPAKGEITRKQLRESPDLAKALESVGIVDDPSRPDSERIETTARVKPEHKPWFPRGQWFPDWNDFVDAHGNVRWVKDSAKSE